MKRRNIKKRVLSLLIMGVCIFSVISAQDTIHVIFKTHLDIGFTDFPHKVVEKYFKDYIPGSIHTAEYMNNNGNGDRFIWTTGAWLIDKFLNDASASEVLMMEQAIRNGYLDWHAYPFSGYNMLMDEIMFEQSLSIASDLDKRFGKKTISAKLTDLPGETRSVINILARHGIKVLHIGTNPGHFTPKVPPVFIWKDPEGNELIVILQGVYGETLMIPGFSHALHFAFTNDNLGPQTPEMVKQIFADVRKKFPNSVVIASTLDNFSSKLLKFSNKLPVVTSEIGSTWIHSAASDPQRTAQYRALQRLLTGWVNEKKADPSDPNMKKFARKLMMVTEHTGGLDEKMHLDFMHWSPSEIAIMRLKENYQDMEKSWDEARDYIRQAESILKGTGFESEIESELGKLNPQKSSLLGYNEFDPAKSFKTKNFEVRIDKSNGSVISLRDRNKREWASQDNPLGLFWHESFDYQDYEKFRKQYNNTDALWVQFDFGKPMLAGDIKARRIPVVQKSYICRDGENVSVIIYLSFNGDEKNASSSHAKDYGLPEAELKINFPATKKSVEYTLQWFGKKANRLPEAFWFTINPASCDPEGWLINVINSFLSPLDVVSYGGRNLQAFNKGVFYKKNSESMEIHSLDCAIVAPGRPQLLDFNDKVPDLNGGWHFNLYNNKWGTNFPTWYDDDALFRFELIFSD